MIISNKAALSTARETVAKGDDEPATLIVRKELAGSCLSELLLENQQASQLIFNRFLNELKYVFCSELMSVKHPDKAKPLIGLLYKQERAVPGIDDFVHPNLHAGGDYLNSQRNYTSDQACRMSAIASRISHYVSLGKANGIELLQPLDSDHMLKTLKST
ncbi:MAG: hypothetical protein ACXV7F_03220 [Methylomonas sp.]